MVESFSPASGSVFSLPAPPDNATRNFTKIVQRMPVRVKVPLDVAREGFLRPGPFGCGEGRYPRGGRAHGRPGRRGALRSRYGRVSIPFPAAVPVPAEPAIDKRRMVAFLCMVFGMFMAILDIQIVSPP